MFEQNPLYTLESELNTSKPDFIGLSVRNIDTRICKILCLFNDLKPLMGTIRSKTPAPVVLGGAAVSVMPEELLPTQAQTGQCWETGEGSSPNYWQRFHKVRPRASCLVLHGLRTTYLQKYRLCRPFFERLSVPQLPSLD